MCVCVSNRVRLSFHRLPHHTFSYSCESKGGCEALSEALAEVIAEVISEGELLAEVFEGEGQRKKIR